MVRPCLALVVLLWIVAAGGAQTQEPGSIVGHIRLKIPLPGAALASSAYATRAVHRDKHPLPEIRNVVISLKNVSYRGALPVRTIELRQEQETFVPHVTAITRGSTVDFPNDDPIYHNVFSLSSAATFNLGRYPKGDSRHETLSRIGVVKVYCQIHSHMSATILVFDHPYFAIPEIDGPSGRDGSFTLPNVPPGDYTLIGWHERVRENTEAQVHVDRGKVSTIPDMVLPIQADQR
jgi:plastocyanin